MIKERQRGAVVGRELVETRREDMIPQRSERRTPGRNRTWPGDPAPGLEDEEKKTGEGQDLGVIGGETEGAGAATKGEGGERDPVRAARMRKVLSQLRRKMSC